MEWIEPKTDWNRSSKFTYVDYNRIRNNLLYVNEKLNDMYPDIAVELDLGEPKTGYADKYYPSEFNAFEDALESFKRVGQDVNIGDKKNFKGNDPFIMADELNRLEKCSLRWKNAQPVVQSVTISPASFSVGKNETKQLSIVIIPSDLTYTVVWESSDTAIAIVDSNGTVTGVSGGSFTISAKVQCKGKIYEITSTGNVVSGTFFEYGGNSYYYDFVYLGSNIDGNGLATVISRYVTDGLRGRWMDGGFDYIDANAAYRNTIQSFINSNFSNELKNSLQNATKTVMGWDDTKGISATSLSAKYFLLSANEIGLSSIYITPKLDGNPYSYLIGNNARIDGEVLSVRGYEANYQLLRNRWYQSQSLGNGMTGYKNGAVHGIGVSQDEFLRPLFFISTSQMVKAKANSDGSYSIDWTNTSGKPLGSLPVGTIIRDDSGTR